MTASMSTIKNIQAVQSIITSFKAIIVKDNRIDTNFTAQNSEIANLHQKKVTQLDSLHNQRIADANSQANSKVQQLQAIMSELDNIERLVPQKVMNKYRSNSLSAISAKNPDFSKMSEITAQINDTSLIGLIKKIFKLSVMVNSLTSEIESARTFISGEKQKCSAYLTQSVASINQEFQKDKAAADKEEFDRAEQNKQHYTADTSALRSELESLMNGKELKCFGEHLAASLGSLGAFEEDWNDYTPAEAYPEEIMLGAILVPTDLPPSVFQFVKDKIPFACQSEQRIILPMTASMHEPLNIKFLYDKQKKETVMAGVQSILLKIIKFMPVLSFSLTYIDPNDRGTNLGLLQKLSAITAADMRMKVYASKDDIEKRLKELETFVDQTSAQIAGFENIYTYNITHEVKIPYQFIVINDYPVNLEHNSAESLKVLINNSKKCGISIIYNSGDSLNEGSITADLTIKARNNGTTVNINGRSYDFIFDGVIPDCELFLEKVKNVYNEGLKVDNRFASFFNLSSKTAYMDSTQSMRIPFAVDSAKHMISLELGGAQSAHAILSGRTGSGKSTTLHMLMSSIVMNYHPDDVELWLVDYKKVEFAEYLKNMPPHVRLLGLERNAEFTFSLLDKIDEEFQRRLELFKSKGVNTITEYKERYGTKSLPRVIFIIDEFHQMTQAIKNEPKYVQILENILSEYRVFGLSCVFSDQAISDGLRGLTEKGRKQISIRIAMENDISEVRETLALDSSLYDDSLKSKILKMSKGDVIFKKVADNGEIMIDKYKTILITRDERVAVINRAMQNSDGNRTKKDPLVIDGQKRSELEEATVKAYEKVQLLDFTRQVPLYIGTPVTLDPCFVLNLRKKTDSNILIIGADDELRASILLHTIYSFKRLPDTTVYVFAYKTDEIYRQYKKQISELLSQADGIFDDLSDICFRIEQSLKYLNPDNSHHILLCWLGLEEIADEFSLQQEKQQILINKSPSAPEPVNAVDALIKEIEMSLNNIEANNSNGSLSAPLEKLTSEVIYDARPDINELFTKGSRYNLYSLVTYSSVKMIRQTKFIKTESFEHKIALSMSVDDSTTYLGRGAYASGLDALTAVYDDGSGTIRTFRPYLIT